MEEEIANPLSNYSPRNFFIDKSLIGACDLCSHYVSLGGLASTTRNHRRYIVLYT